MESNSGFVAQHSNHANAPLLAATCSDSSERTSSAACANNQATHTHFDRDLLEVLASRQRPLSLASRPTPSLPPIPTFSDSPTTTIQLMSPPDSSILSRRMSLAQDSVSQQNNNSIRDRPSSFLFSPLKRLSKRGTFDFESILGFGGGIQSSGGEDEGEKKGKDKEKSVIRRDLDYEILKKMFPGVNIPKTSYLLGASSFGVVYARDGSLLQLIMNWNRNSFELSKQLCCDLPEGIISFKMLTLLQLNNQGLTGSIPRDIGNLDNLRELSLAKNALAGPIPDSLCNLKRLVVLDLHENELSAPLPLRFTELTELNILRLNNNEISGGIPTDIGRIRGLQQLYLGHNRMDGEIPSSIGMLERLDLLQLQHNKFRGPLPREISSLKNLKFLFLNSNRLIGELDSNMFSGMKNLDYLLLNRNQFSGAIPSILFSLRNIQIIRMDHNYFDEYPRSRIPLTMRMGMQIGLKKIVITPQYPGSPPYQIVPTYSEFPPDVLHPSDHILLQRNRHARQDRLTSLYDLPDNPNRWTPSEVAFWVRVHGGFKVEEVCESIIELGITGAQFFRLQEDDLETALGVFDAGVRVVIGVAMARVLAVANGLLPPGYDTLEGPNVY